MQILVTDFWQFNVSLNSEDDQIFVMFSISELKWILCDIAMKKNIFISLFNLINDLC